MLTLLKKTKRTLLAPVGKARRDAVHRLAPYAVISFPKSGRTWLRVFLGKYFHAAYGTPESLLGAGLLRPDARVPRILFAHPGSETVSKEGLAEETGAYAGKRVLFLARDPRDIVVSYFFHMNKRATKYEDAVTVPDTLSAFIRNDRFGLPQIIRFMNAWYASRGTYEDWKLLTYEDLQKGKTAFQEALGFVGVTDIDSQALDQAYEGSRFDKMRELERSDAYGNDILRPGDVNDPDSYKVRKGKVGGYREEFSPEDDAYAREALKALDPAFGYR